jgi:hypothetical protein
LIVQPKKEGTAADRRYGAQEQVILYLRLGPLARIRAPEVHADPQFHRTCPDIFAHAGGSCPSVAMPRRLPIARNAIVVAIDLKSEWIFNLS